MQAEQTAIQAISFLSRSESRVRILDELLESGSATRRELHAALDSSRSTIARSLASLEDRNWVKRNADGYQLTPAGELITEEFMALADTVETTQDLSDFLTWFPLSAFGLELESLQNATVTVSSDADPYAPGRTQTEFLRSASRVRAMLPSIDIEGVRVAHQEIVEENLSAELIVSASVEPEIVSGEIAQLFREQIRSGGLSVFVANGALPFYLGLSDRETVQIGVEDDDGMPRALLETTDRAVRAWGTDVFGDYRTKARPKPLEEFD